MGKTNKVLLLFALLFGGMNMLFAQSNGINLDYYSPKEYEVGEISVEGADHLDHNSVILLSGISVGEKIYLPSDKISMAPTCWASRR